MISSSCKISRSRAVDHKPQCTFVSPLKMLIPGPQTLQFNWFREGLRHQYFLNAHQWFSCAAKAENQWSTGGSAFQSVVPGPTALASPRSLLEMQTFRFHPNWIRTSEGEAQLCVFYLMCPPGDFWCTLKFENHWFRVTVLSLGCVNWNKNT